MKTRQVYAPADLSGGLIDFVEEEELQRKKGHLAGAKHKN